MNELTNSTIIKKANIYFDGKVTSRSIVLADGSKQSLGIMMVGEYTFDTQEAEIMEIMSGELEIKLTDDSEFRTLHTPETFEVPANSSFDLKIHSITDYCCSYIKA